MNKSELEELDARILAVLKKEGPLLTPDLADRLEEDRQRVYRRCRHLRDQPKGLKAAPEKSSRPLFFSPLIGEVVTRQNKGTLDKLTAALDAIVWKHAKKGQRLSPKQKAAIRRDVGVFLKKRGRVTSAYERQQHVIFRRRFEKVMRGTGGSHIAGTWAATPYLPDVIVWSFDGTLPGDPTLGLGPPPDDD